MKNNLERIFEEFMQEKNGDPLLNGFKYIFTKGSFVGEILGYTTSFLSFHYLAPDFDEKFVIDLMSGMAGYVIGGTIGAIVASSRKRKVIED